MAGGRAREGEPGESEGVLGGIKRLCGRLLGPAAGVGPEGVGAGSCVDTSTTYEKALEYARSHGHFTLEEVEAETACSRQSLKNQLTFLVKAGELESVMRCTICGHVFRDGEDICPRCRRRKRAHAYRLKGDARSRPSERPGQAPSSDGRPAA